MFYHNTRFPSEIFEKSRCIEQETQIIKDIEQELQQCGFVNTSPHSWECNGKTVVLRLVDDFTGQVGQNWDLTFPLGLSKDTMVITDNFVTEITQFEIFRLPNSFFGIYSYVPSERLYDPQRTYGFLSNRFDSRRFGVLLGLVEFHIRSNKHLSLAEIAYITFNCECIKSNGASQVRYVPDADELINNLLPEAWNALDCDNKEKYRDAYFFVHQVLPCKNFVIDFDDVYVRSVLNMVLETYISNYVISLSEKTFRALVTPAPSILYGSRYLNVFLSKLGFDTQEDLVDQSFDQHLPFNGNWFFCDIDYVNSARKTADYLTRKLREDNSVAARVKQSSQHNIEVLQKYADQWPSDYADWIQDLRTRLLKFKNS